MHKFTKDILSVFKKAGVLKFKMSFTEGDVTSLEAEFETRPPHAEPMNAMPKPTERMPTEDELLMWSTPDELEEKAKE